MTDFEVRDDEVKGRHGLIPIRRYEPAAVISSTPLLWLHGGAFSYGDLDMPESDAVARAIAATGRPAIAVDYRRVPPWSWWRAPRAGQLPGFRFPGPLDDVVDVFESIHSQHGGVILGGASAGACLAAAAALRQLASERPVPAGVVLAYGTFHAELPPISPELRGRIRGRHSFMQFRADTVNKMNRNYAGSPGAMNDPFAFPGRHGLQGMPPTLVLDADRDSLRSSGDKFFSELETAGVPAIHRVVAESTHGFLNRPAGPQFTQGIDVMTSWLTGLDRDVAAAS